MGRGGKCEHGECMTKRQVVGGLGSLKGALAGSLLIGTTLTFGTVFVPQFAGIIMYALLIAVLLIRPAGLFPARG